MQSRAAGKSLTRVLWGQPFPLHILDLPPLLGTSNVVRRHQHTKLIHTAFLRLFVIPQLRLTYSPAVPAPVAVLGVLPGSPGPVILGSSGIPAMRSGLPVSLLLAPSPACIPMRVHGVSLISRPVPREVPVPVPFPGPVCAPPAE